jgi:hypothetical protein
VAWFVEYCRQLELESLLGFPYYPAPTVLSRLRRGKSWSLSSPGFVAAWIRRNSDSSQLGFVASHPQPPTHPMLDFDVQRCTRRCSGSDRELKAGEWVYSALVPRGAQVVRLDFAPEAWKGPPENAIGWWKGRVPDGGNQRTAWAPNDVMLDYFEHLENRPEKADVRYVLALLLVRRRVIRLENTLTDDQGNETLVIFCPRNEQESRVEAMLPDDQRIAEIQTELSTLLFGDSSSLMPPPAQPTVEPAPEAAVEAPSEPIAVAQNASSDDETTEEDESDGESLAGALSDTESTEDISADDESEDDESEDEEGTDEGDDEDPDEEEEDEDEQEDEVADDEDEDDEVEDDEDDEDEDDEDIEEDDDEAEDTDDEEDEDEEDDEDLDDEDEQEEDEAADEEEAVDEDESDDSSRQQGESS